MLKLDITKTVRFYGISSKSVLSSKCQGSSIIFLIPGHTY